MRNVLLNELNCDWFIKCPSLYTSRNFIVALQSVYRKNPNGDLESLVFDYILPEQMTEDLHKDYPNGLAYPTRGFLLKFAQAFSANIVRGLTSKFWKECYTDFESSVEDHLKACSFSALPKNWQLLYRSDLKLKRCIKIVRNLKIF